MNPRRNNPNDITKQGNQQERRPKKALGFGILIGTVFGNTTQKRKDREKFV